MSLNGPHIDPQLERHFEGFNPEPPEGAWDRIAATLDRRSKRKVLFWWSSGAAAILLIGSLIFLFRNAPAPQVAQQESADETKSKISLSPAPAAKNPEVPARPHHSETPIRLPESIQYIHPNLTNASTSNVQPDAPVQEEAATASVPLPQGFGISGKGIEMLPLLDAKLKSSYPISFNQNIRHQRRVASPAIEIGMILNPSFNGLNLRLASAWSNYVHEDYLGIRRSQESPLEALQGGLDLALRLRGGLRFNSGLWFTEQGTRQEYNYDISKLPAYRGGTADLFGNRLIEGYFIDPTPEHIHYSGTTRTQRLQIPIQAGYEHRLGLRGGIMVQAGASAALLMSSDGLNISYSNLQLGTGNNNWFRNTQWSALGSISWYRQLNPFMRLGLGFRREQSLSNQYKNGTPLIGKNGNTGFQINLHYRIY